MPEPSEEQDHLARALARLTALRAHIPEKHYSLDQHYVDEFEAGLGHLVALGYDIEEFRIPAAWMHGTTIVNNFAGGSIHRTPPAIDTHLLLTRLDAVLSFFDLRSPKAREIGFRGPRREP